MAGRSRQSANPRGHDRSERDADGRAIVVGSGGARDGAGRLPMDHYRREQLEEMEKVRAVRIQEGQRGRAIRKEVILIELALETIALGMLGKASAMQCYAARSIITQYWGLPRQQIQVSGGMKFDVDDRLQEIERSRLQLAARPKAERDRDDDALEEELVPARDRTHKRPR